MMRTRIAIPPLKNNTKKQGIMNFSSPTVLTGTCRKTVVVNKLRLHGEQTTRRSLLDEDDWDYPQDSAEFLTAT